MKVCVSKNDCFSLYHEIYLYTCQILHISTISWNTLSTFLETHVLEWLFELPWNIFIYMSILHIWNYLHGILFFFFLLFFFFETTQKMLSHQIQKKFYYVCVQNISQTISLVMSTFLFFFILNFSIKECLLYWNMIILVLYILY